LRVSGGEWQVVTKRVITHIDWDFPGIEQFEDTQAVVLAFVKLLLNLVETILQSGRVVRPNGLFWISATADLQSQTDVPEILAR
jgi:hypothetical protein